MEMKSFFNFTRVYHIASFLLSQLDPRQTGTCGTHPIKKVYCSLWTDIFVGLILPRRVPDPIWARVIA